LREKLVRSESVSELLLHVYEESHECSTSLLCSHAPVVLIEFCLVHYSITY